MDGRVHTYSTDHFRMSLCCPLLGGDPIRNLAQFASCVSVLIFPSTLQVAVDGNHVLQYDHRVALQRVDTLSISGHVQVTAVAILPSLVSFFQSGWFSFLGLN